MFILVYTSYKSLTFFVSRYIRSDEFFGILAPSLISYCVQISPRDIENVILRHPGVADVTAVGVADVVVNGNGQLVKAVVVLKPGYDDVTSNKLLTYANRNSD